MLMRADAHNVIVYAGKNVLAVLLNYSVAHLGANGAAESQAARLQF